MSTNRDYEKVIASNQNSTNAPAGIQIGEKVFYATDLTPGGYMTLYSEIRRLCLQDLPTPLQAVMGDLKTIPAKFHQMIIDAAVARQSGGGSEPTREMIGAKLNTPEGARIQLSLMCQQCHPGIKPENIPIDAENLDSVLSQLWKQTERAELLKLQGGTDDPKA